MNRLSTRQFARDCRGAAILEFALVMPVVGMAIFGLVNVGLLINALSSMNHTVQEAARCSAVDAVRCATPQATLAFARARFHGVIRPSFTVTTEACGSVVSAAATFDLNVAVKVYAIPIVARACYPRAVSV